MRKLIRNACIISQDPEIGRLDRGDILVEGERIAEVGVDLTADDVEVIDAGGLIAIPGLVDTHRHLWMTLLRGFISDGTWGSYLVETFWGRRLLYRPEESYIATYAGALEALDAGVTTVLDFDDCVTAPGQAYASVQALEDAGVRSVYCYGLEARPSIQLGAAPVLSPTSDWHQADAERLRRERLASDDARITMGVTVRNLEELPFAETEKDFGLARRIGARRITTHAGVSDRVEGRASWLDQLHAGGWLGDDLVISHGQTFSDHELDLLAAAGASLAISAESEMGIGAEPITWRALEHGVTVSIGADSVGSLSGDLFRQMQFALKAGRGSRARSLQLQGTQLMDVGLPAAKMLEIATMGGARALGLEAETGSLTPGKRADITLLEHSRVGMFSGAAPEQVVVLQANSGDVDTVLVDGAIVKRGGRLTGVDLEGVADRLERSRAYLDSALEQTDQSDIRAATAALFGV